MERHICNGKCVNPKEDKTITNIYTPNNKTQNTWRKDRNEGRNRKFGNINQKFKTSLSIMNSKTRHKSKKDIKDLTNTTN